MAGNGLIPKISSLLCQASSLIKIAIGQFLNKKYEIIIVNMEANRLYPRLIKLVAMHINVIRTTIAVHSANLVGKLLDRSSPWLLKNISSLKVTLLNADKLKKITNDATSPIAFNSRILLMMITPIMLNIVAILNSLSRDSFVNCIIVPLRNSINFIVTQKVLCFKSTLLSALIIFNTSVANATPTNSLQKLVSSYERKYQIPNMLLWSVAKVESGINPLALNISGKTYSPKSKEEALRLLKSSMQQGISNIDIGLMQINFRFHGKNFKDVNEMLDIHKNIAYSAQLLCNLYKIHGGWREAVQHYHSSKAEYHLKYARKVLLSWLENYK